MAEEVESIDIRCLTCGTWFSSPIVFSHFDTFENSVIAGNTVNCPRGHITPCNKENTRIRFKGGGGFVGNDI
jgi:hypothetical protein